MGAEIGPEGVFFEGILDVNIVVKLEISGLGSETGSRN